MKEKYDILHKPTLSTMPEYYTVITCQLQLKPIYNDQRNPNLHGHRIYRLNEWDDCQIIELLCKNANVLNQEAQKRYPLAITSFNDDSKNSRSGNRKTKHGIKCPYNNQNYLTRRLCFKMVDKLQEGWTELPADDYYTHPYKADPADKPHKDTIKDWHFFSKRTNALRPQFLQDEPLLIKWLASRFKMTDKITCRTTMTNDSKRIGAIHIWVLKSAFEEFKYVFNFDCKAHSDNLNWLTILNA